MKEAVKCCMQVWMYIKKEIREFFYGLKNVKVAIADAKIKSDKIDAKILADLTRGDLVRQRIFLEGKELR